MELELRQSAVTPGRAVAAPTVVHGVTEMRISTPAADSVVPAIDTVVVNGFRIVGRAPVSLDSLKALLKKIK